jgi:hypothetical protein
MTEAENPDDGGGKKHERQKETCDQEHIQRIFRPVTGGAQLIHRIFVHQRLAQVEPVDDLTDGAVILRSKRCLARNRLGIHPGALARADLFALGRNRLHAFGQIAAFKEGNGKRVECREHRDRNEKRDEHGWIGQRGCKVR